eukprot:scaffold930_cov408-Prasinococcus_capsulatus_cf.AAC.10
MMMRAGRLPVFLPGAPAWHLHSPRRPWAGLVYASSCQVLCRQVTRRLPCFQVLCGRTRPGLYFSLGATALGAHLLLRNRLLARASLAFPGQYLEAPSSAWVK